MRELNKLQVVSLASCKVRNLTPLKGMQQLKQLDISGNPVTNLKVLKDLKKLQKLTLSRDQLGETAMESLKSMLSNCQLVVKES